MQHTRYCLLMFTERTKGGGGGGGTDGSVIAGGIIAALIVLALIAAVIIMGWWLWKKFVKPISSYLIPSISCAFLFMCL